MLIRHTFSVVEVVMIIANFSDEVSVIKELGKYCRKSIKAPYFRVICLLSSAKQYI